MKITNKDMQLYAITDRQWLGEKDFLQVIENVLKNGATFLQLREKNCTHEERVALAKQIKPLAQKYHVPFVINDDIYAAKEADVDGVHIGQSDMDYTQARAILGPDKIIGMTAKTIEQAQNAERLGAAYIGVGAVFHTTTKTDAKDMNKETLLSITNSVQLPIVAIGGITYDNMDILKDTGVNGIAVVSSIFAAKDEGCATAALKQKSDTLFSSMEV